MIWHLLSWYTVIVVLGWVTFPLTYRIFNKLPDRGYSLSRIMGLLLWGFGFWLFTSLGLLQNHPGGIIFALVALLSVSLLAGWSEWREILQWLRQHWRFLLITEIVFLISFLFMVFVRASDPNATGTEKPMELAFINAVLNSETFPPHDPWLSGYAISYYHFGFVLAGMLAKVTFTSGGEAFNLMLALVFALGATGAYGILFNLLKLFGRSTKKHFQARSWALFGPLFLLFVSNLEGVLEVLHQAGVGWDMQTGTSRFWAWVNIDSLRNPPLQPLSLIPQRFWWWWQASRVVHDIDLLGNVSSLSPIDEFPAFSFLLGDLHPHVLVIPFVMLVVGLALNIFRGGMDREAGKQTLKVPFRLDIFLVSAITLGGITFLNTWDLPVYFVLLVGAYLINRVLSMGWGWNRLFEVFVFAALLGVTSLLLYAPFLISFQSQAGGILPNIVYPTRGLYLWLMFAPLFVPIFLLFSWLRKNKAQADWRQGVTMVVVVIVGLYLLSVLLGFGVSRISPDEQLITSQGVSSFSSLLFSALRHRFTFGISLLTLALLLIAGLAYLLGFAARDAQVSEIIDPLPFVLLLVVLAGLMVLAPEFVYLRDHFGTRMNTVFKFYYQAWMLWSLAAAFGAVVLIKLGSWYSRILVVGVVLLSLVYPLLAFPAKTNNFKPNQNYTLDASAYFEVNSPNEAAALKWLTQQPLGVVAEAIGGQYSGYARISTLSGHPTVLGWPGHEGQWRGGYDEVGTRESDIRTLYETSDWATAFAIIKRYDIGFIYIGSLEMNTYALNPVKFEQNLQAGFVQNGVWVYVVPENLKEK